MTEAIAFLLVSPAGSENVFGGSPSVVWNSVQVNYLQEGKQLESLLQEIRKYIMSSIDKKGDSIAQEYCNCTREELLSLALSIKRSELQVEVLIKELATSRT